MSLDWLDQPDLLETFFFPRPAQPSMNGSNGIYDGTIPVDDETVLGYRLHVSRPRNPVIIFFHGNGEIAADYDSIVPLFHNINVSILIMDFRGYGWSTGKPTVTTLLSDAHAVHQHIERVLTDAGISATQRIIMGRSLGSAPAIELASSYPAAYCGLIIESGFASILPLLIRRGFPKDVFQGQPDPVGNERKVSGLNLPLLVIHGERDQLIHVSEGQKLYDASPSDTKMILRIEGLGHNDLIMAAVRYFSKIRAFLNLACAE